MRGRKGKRHNKDLRRLESGEEDARGSHLFVAPRVVGPMTSLRVQF